jgi:hypothetical protein
MELKRRKVRRGARRYLEHVLDGRPLTAYRARAVPDYDHDDMTGIDTTPTPPTTPDSFYRSVYFGLLARPDGHLLVAGMVHPDDR